MRHAASGLDGKRKMARIAVVDEQHMLEYIAAAAAARQRALLCPAHWVRLALSPTRVSAVANHLCDLPPVASARRLAAGPRGITPRRPPAGGPPRRPLGSDHG
jgi:hypothetical protein